MDRDAARLRLDALGAETWRLYLDLDRQHRGSGAFDVGLGGRPEPGYLRSVLAAHTWLARGVGDEVTLQDYDSLQRHVTAHAPPGEVWRPAASWVQVPRVAIEPGVEALWAVWGARLDETAPAHRGHVRLVMDKHAGRPDRLEAEVATVLREGQAAIRLATDAERLGAVARLHQQLELLHPTRDANTRRHLVLLQRLLGDAGLSPCLLTEPNHVYVRTPTSWARCLEDGVARWRALTHALARGLDAPTALTEFDVRHRPLGSALGRWHRSEGAPSAWLTDQGP